MTNNTNTTNDALSNLAWGMVDAGRLETHKATFLSDPPALEEIEAGNLVFLADHYNTAKVLCAPLGDKVLVLTTESDGEICEYEYAIEDVRFAPITTVDSRYQSEII